MTEFKLNCPNPLHYDHIVIAHGGGGRLMQQLLSNIIQTTFQNPILDQQHDSAVMAAPAGRLAFTTDSYVIKPLFFPGGDIGKLAVCGTLNDLAMSGAKPLHLSCSLILEEGLPIADLQKILQSMQTAATNAGVSIVTGDTKVVDRGKGDGLYINTAGIGIVSDGLAINPRAIQPGDAIIVSGDLGRHGIAVMLEREGLNFSHNIESDCADLSGLVGELLAAGIELHCLRDVTRGGLASVLLELANSCGLSFNIHENALPIRDDVRAACDVLGFDPLYIANEGCLVAFLPQERVGDALNVLQQHPLGRQSALIGEVSRAESRDRLTLITRLGIARPLALLSGEQLPRIC